jgi:TetR/AcrR family transcriptional regulator, transcriptional repressor for nem operon
MGHSRDDKQHSHERIVEVAARRIRESGTETPGVAEIMREAGLTHGGFYKHFASRDELVAQAGRRAFADGAQFAERATADAEDPFAAYVDAYLSDEHRDHPGIGCGCVALGADAAHGTSQPLRAAYGDQVRAFIDLLERMQDDDSEAGRRRATTAMSAMVGAMLTARAVDDPHLSEQILSDVREQLLAR